MRFEWERGKAAGDEKKRTVSFDEAVRLFCDPLAATFDDPDHSQREGRFVTV